MPSLRRALLLAVLLALAAPATAPAALRIGIAENTPNLFADPLFQALGAKYARVVVSYDVTTSGDDELQRITDYLNGAAAAGVEPLVTFEHARGAAEICNQRKHRRKRQCRLPTARMARCASGCGRAGERQRRLCGAGFGRGWRGCGQLRLAMRLN